MTGNAAEEGLMQQIGNPSHLDTGRITVPAAALSGYGAGYLAWRLLPFVTVFTSVLVGILVCGLVAWRMSHWFAIRVEARKVREFEAKRAFEVDETRRKLAAMRAARKT